MNADTPIDYIRCNGCQKIIAVVWLRDADALDDIDETRCLECVVELMRAYNMQAEKEVAA